MLAERLQLESLEGGSSPQRTNSLDERFLGRWEPALGVEGPRANGRGIDLPKLVAS
jgi:hypothetical protein